VEITEKGRGCICCEEALSLSIARLDLYYFNQGGKGVSLMAILSESRDLVPMMNFKGFASALATG
jgi:hypothetical protein